MIRSIAITLASGGLLAAGAFAQPPIPPGPNGGAGVPPPVSAEDSGSVSPPAGEKLEGDIITLINGKQLKRVQVVKKTAAEYWVELAPGISPMKIRRRQVESIEYDDIDPSKRDAGKDGSGAGGQGEVVADPIEPELNENLGKQVMHTPRDIPGRPLTRVLFNVGKELGVTVEFSEAVKQMPPEKLLWTINIPPATTLRMLLENDIPRDFPALEVKYQFDKVLIDAKQAE